jgi:predicted small lipoprotein YifL
MSGRSSARNAVAGVAVAAALVPTLVACGKSGPKKPEADPTQVGKLAAKMAREIPSPAAVRDCTPKDLEGGTTLTFRSLMLIGKLKLPDRPEESEWINPPELDSPSVRTLLDGKDATATRQAAAEFLAAPFYVAYRIDHVNAPMALGIKELKIGTIGTRVIRYEKTGLPSCVLVFNFQNDPKVSDDAIAVSDKAEIDPAVAKILRDDLTQQWIKQAPRGTTAAASTQTPPAKP